MAKKEFKFESIDTTKLPKTVGKKSRWISFL